MIVGIGIDTIAVKRFMHWDSYSMQQLSRIFSPQEISYCHASTLHYAERYAVRFATREALFKALSMYQPEHVLPFLTLCRLVRIEKNNLGAPTLAIDWNILEQQYGIKPVEVLVSLTHTATTATAWVILQKK